ncbi:phospholipase C, phosphocholine-specific [Jatrophihabitans telluris]|uniref:phospholipase C n=1 Tax=Jatrophihabitans telluris TaxID=2038343 RepID=A0ABY4R125_9ACTN|nr:phospholipase C, phosphocholine-specific [Jatrophihabitans telluris]UQX88816.1 phospholipase C, phosphocholine-specific [Jatrophihabitans telluris]
MVNVDRRRFLQLAGGTVGAAALSAMFSDSIARAAAIPANRATGTIRDVEHIVILMQENRSFDHYFGTMRGVRGFSDPHPAMLPSGKSVWHQSDGHVETLPFRPDKDNLALTFIEDLDHSWDPTHAMFNGGRYDQWIPNKTTTAMAHLERKDLPFHYALADAFTVCDAYHCSLLGPTDPNRYYMWTGWVGNDGKGGGPVIANDEIGYDWTTYPERLQKAGVDWKIYQDEGAGLDAAHFWGWGSDPYIGNYGDNSLLYFHQYQNAPADSPLAQRARTGTDVKDGGGFFDILTADVTSGKLPSVSWIVAPEAYTEHPAWPGGYGAWYTAQVLNALTSNPEVWSKTALIITFDENDGFFDHMVPPYPNVGGLGGHSTVSTANELFTGTAGTAGGTNGTAGPYGLGVRVPMLVVSPWSTGGWVCSETFDHTSLIRFIEARHGVHEPNITPWRRTVSGDLTSAFDFGRTATKVPNLPDTSAYKPTASAPPSYHPVPPTHGALPVQEEGIRPSRALGYQLAANISVLDSALRLKLRNHGRLGAHIQARSLTIPGAPFSYTIGREDHIAVDLPHPGQYDLSLHGPNGFYRRYAGTPDLSLAVDVLARGHSALQLTMRLHGQAPRRVHVRLTDAYGKSHTVEVSAHRPTVHIVETSHTYGWYDLTITTPADPAFAYQLAGRLETGRPSSSDPQLGRGRLRSTVGGS